MSLDVYKSINSVQHDLAKIGIAKDSTNSFDKYNFRGIDAVYNVLSPLLAKHGLCILPRMISRKCEEHQSQKGGVLFYVTIEAEFDFVCAYDGSKHTVKTFGEAMDRGDKATNKAMSAAYKYAAFQAFCIPTEGDNDADSSSHEVKAKTQGTKIKPVPTVDLPPDDMERVQEVVTDILIAYEEGREMDCIELFHHVLTDNDEKIAAWNILAPHSKLRAFLKQNKPQPQAA